MCIFCSSHSLGSDLEQANAHKTSLLLTSPKVNLILNYLNHLFFQCSLVQVPAPFTWLGKQETRGFILCSMYFSFSLLVPYYSSNPINYTSCIYPCIYPRPFFPSVISLVPATSFSLPFHSVAFLCIYGCKPAYGGLRLYYTMLYKGLEHPRFLVSKRVPEPILSGS